MNYEEKYKEALTYVKNLVEHNVISAENASKCFPELAESEDERTRREIIEHLRQDIELEQILSEKKGGDWIAWLKKQGEKSQGKSITKVWKDMRLEVFAQASGNRHEPNYSYNNAKIFSLNDIDEIIEKISEQNLANSAKICKDDK